MRHALNLVLLAGAAMLWPGPAGAEEEELIWQDGKWVRQAPPKEGTPEGELAILRRDLDGRRYKDAVSQAEKFLKRYPDTPLREEVLALAGEAEIRRDRYWQAYGWYERQLREFPNGPAMERALQREMEVAQAFLAGKKRPVGKVLMVPAEQDGIEILEKVAERAPGTPMAEVALLTIGDHYFRKGSWPDAADSYDGFLKLFPKSPRASYAELRAAEAFRNAYRGPMWDDTPLLEAEQRYKNFAEHFPAEARQRQVEEVLQQIRSQRAAKEYEAGQFYLRTKAPQAAGYYFRLVMAQYGDTAWAARAESAMAGLPLGAEGPPAAAPPPPAEAATPPAPPVAPLATQPATRPASGPMKKEASP